ncbi:MAG: 6,7-dimethyl-8-ribityllumazine synthase [Chlamydiales bacterium]
MPFYEGDLNGKGSRIALVASRFNLSVTERMLKGAIEGLKSCGIGEEELSIAWVPGAFEIPLIAKKMAESKQYDAVLCIGAVIRGETAHFEYVASQAASGILQISLSTGIPVIFSVLTTETLQQALDRSEAKGKNIGHKGALAAIEMVNLLRDLENDYRHSKRD